MKKLFYHPMLKAIAWVLLFFSITVTIAGTVLSAIYCLGIQKEDGGEYVIAIEEVLVEKKRYQVENYLEAYLSGEDADVAYYDEIFDPQETNFRFYVKGYPHLTNDLYWYYDGSQEHENFDVILYGNRHFTIEYGIDTDYEVLDEFLIAQALGIVAYEYSDYVIGGTIGGLVFAVLLIVYLVKVAGRRKPNGEVSKSKFHRIPYEILLVTLVGCYVLVAIGIDAALSYSLKFWIRFLEERASLLLLAALIWVVLFAMTAGVIHTFIVRIYAGKWYQTFLLYYVFRYAFLGLRMLGRGIRFVARKVWEKLRFFVSYLPLYARFVIGYVLFTVLEAVVLVCMYAELDNLLICWGICKVIVTPILLWYVISLRMVEKYAEQLVEGNYKEQLDTKLLLGPFKRHGEHLRTVEDGLKNAVEERVKSERMKTELITNVSHDIKTPLTSIINYVDLLKKEDLQPDVAKEYVEVLDRQSARLKKLTEDVIEASKAASGAITAQIENTSLEVLLPQVLGEYEDRMTASGLTLVRRLPQELPEIMADARLLWRIFSNLLDNAIKYSLEGTRVYFTVEEYGEQVRFAMRNISANELQYTGEELMERFVRGDGSRNSQGSGLGLSIAKSLLELMNGDMEIQMDGDLFKVLIRLPKVR